MCYVLYKSTAAAAATTTTTTNTSSSSIQLTDYFVSDFQTSALFFLQRTTHLDHSVLRP